MQDRHTELSEVSHGLSVCRIYGAMPKKLIQGLGYEYDIREIDEDLYLAVLQAAKQAQSAA